MNTYLLCRFIELLYERQGNSVVIPAATQQAPINIPAVSAHTASTLLHAALRPLYSTAYTLYASTHSATVSKYASIGSHRVMVSFGVFKTIWISACPTGERLSRPPPDPPRPRGRGGSGGGRDSRSPVGHAEIHMVLKTPNDTMTR